LPSGTPHLPARPTARADVLLSPAPGGCEDGAQALEGLALQTRDLHLRNAQPPRRLHLGTLLVVAVVEEVPVSLREVAQRAGQRLPVVASQQVRIGRSDH